MNSLPGKIATAIVSLFLIVYVSYQAYLALHVSVKTQRATVSTVQDAVSSSGFVIHNETLINGDTGGKIIDYTKQDGDRVAKGGVVANLYATSADAENERQLQELDQKISQLDETGSYEEVAAIDIDVLNSEINQAFLALAQAASDGDMEQLADTKTQLLGLLNKKQLATGTQQNYDQKLSELQKQRTDLQQKISGNVSTITSPASGYFVSSTDGYEEAFDPKNVLSITPDEVDKLMSLAPSPKSGAVGKVVSEYEWYVVADVSPNDAQKLRVGRAVSVRFLLSAESGVPATVAALNKGDDGRYAVALECDYMTSKLAVSRKQDLKITTSEYTGLKVSTGDVHIVKGNKGVYVLNGNAVKFKKIDVLYSGNGYLLSKCDSTDAGLLQQYDEIITTGDDLYDGKVVV